MTREEILKTLNQNERLLRDAGVRELRLFGSHARGDAGPNSDIDLLVEFTETQGYFQLLRLREQLEELLGRSVDLGTPDSLHRRIRDQVLRESIRAA